MVTLTFPAYLIPTAIMLIVWFFIYAQADSNSRGSKYLNPIETTIGIAISVIIWLVFYFVRT